MKIRQRIIYKNRENQFGIRETVEMKEEKELQKSMINYRRKLKKKKGK